MRLKRKQSQPLNLCFIPMVYEKQRCFVIFTDTEVGEFMYEIIGEVTLPSEIIEVPQTPIQPPVFVDEMRVWPMDLDFKNYNISRARQEIERYTFDKRKQSAPVIPKRNFFSFISRIRFAITNF